MVERHRAADAPPLEPDLAAKAAKRIERLTRDATQIRAWLAAHPDDRRRAKGAIRKSNRTDNESATMATGKGALQGYTGVAAVDGRHQIIVAAQAQGTGSEQELLIPVVQAMRHVMADDSLVTADAGYHSEANLQQLATMQVDALIADNRMRRRDERFVTQARYQAAPDVLYDKTRPAAPRPATAYQPRDFTYDAAARTCVCPAGKSFYRKGSAIVTNGFLSAQFQGTLRDCLPCAQRAQCLRTPATTKVRHVAFCHGRVVADPLAPPPETQTSRVQQRIDSPDGRLRYGQRFATVEPVFGNLRANKGLDRFTLRGRTKVNAQWQLFCLVQSIEKLAHHGYAQ